MQCVTGGVETRDVLSGVVHLVPSVFVEAQPYLRLHQAAAVFITTSSERLAGQETRVSVCALLQDILPAQRT